MWAHLGSLGSRVVPRPQRSGPYGGLSIRCLAHNGLPLKAGLLWQSHPERRRGFAVAFPWRSDLKRNVVGHTTPATLNVWGVAL